MSSGITRKSSMATDGTGTECGGNEMSDKRGTKDMTGMGDTGGSKSSSSSSSSSSSRFRSSSSSSSSGWPRAPTGADPIKSNEVQSNQMTAATTAAAAAAAAGVALGTVDTVATVGALGAAAADRTSRRRIPTGDERLTGLLAIRITTSPHNKWVRVASPARPTTTRQ